VPSLAELNGLEPTAASAMLHRCCGAARWVEGMLAGRPFASRAKLFETAARIWEQLGREDWLEAFAQHPRIGAKATSAWSSQEQEGVEGAGRDVLDALARGNEEYAARFGWVFLICATGKSASEMLAALRSRLANDPATELRVAAAEHAEITRIRLEKLLES
jgi:2-oxo-4-hydroxy-4-carboxy-5-ureidoimidazoline decarboxylase